LTDSELAAGKAVWETYSDAFPVWLADE
jgi:hypothetical protein